MVSEADCRCSEIEFCAFVDQHSNFSDLEQIALKEQILNPHLSATLYVVITLTFWSVIGGLIDLFILPFFIAYAWFETGSIASTVWVPLSFMVVNVVAKYGYVQYRLGSITPTVKIIIAALPYVGPLYLLQDTMSNSKLLKTALVQYAGFKKKEFKTKLFTRFKH